MNNPVFQIMQKKYFFYVVGTVVTVMLLVLIGYVKQMQPRTDRNWDPEFAKLPRVSLDGNMVTITNIRNWTFNETGVTGEEYFTETYDIDELEQVWFVVEPFILSDLVAHTYFTFDFNGHEPVSFSIEARREEDEEYSGVSGLFNQYELMYLWGTERDLLYRRAVYLDHDVYMYPLQLSAEQEQALFWMLAKETQGIAENPRFYNTITSNCTNELARIVNEMRPHTVPVHLSYLLTGLADQYLYRLGYIPSDQPFDQIRQQFKIDEFVEQHYTDERAALELRQHLAE